VKKLLVTDTHLGLYSDADAWLDIVLNFFKYVVKYCHKNNINQIIHLGDFFDNRKSLNTKTQHQAHRIAKILGAVKDLETHIIVGNHDCYYKNQIHPNTLELFKEYKHIKVIDEPTLLDGILLVPWGCVPTKGDAHNVAYCFGHFAINGFYMNDSYKCKDGISKATFKDFKKVLSGHFHTPSSNNGIHYLGAPYGQTFHDAGGVRGFHTFEDGKLDFIEYEGAPKFIKIHTVAEPLDESSIKGNIVRIIFDKDYGTTANQDIIDNILKSEPFLYSVNFTNIDSDDGEIVSDDSIEMDSKEQIVDQFIDNQAFPTNIHIGMLKSMFKKLMREAGETGIKIRTAEGTKIECESVGFQNFLSFGSVWQDIPLHNGVNFVTGIDMDKGKSNGAGKSSFLETIPFALFGKTARDIKQDQIINWKNKKNCQVVFRFKINEDIYEINRKLKPNVLEIFKNGDLIDQDAHKMDYQSMFEEIFGMDVKMFMSLVHSNVNSSANILSMKKAEKRKFLERMFGLEIYSKMNELSNSKLRSVEEKRYKIDTDITASDDKVESAVRMRIKFNLEIKSKQETLEKVKEVEEELERLKENNPTLNTDIETATKDKSTLNNELNKIINVFGKIESALDTEILHMKKEIEKVDNQEEQRKKNKKIQERIDKVVQKAGTIEEITEKIDKLHVDESGLSEKVDKENKNISVLEKDLVELRTDLKNIETNLDLLAEGKCPVCGQDVKDPKTHYKKEQTTFKKKIALKEKKLKDVNENKSFFTKAWDDIKEKIKTLAKIKEALYKLKGELKQVDSEEKKDDLKKKYEAKLIEIGDLRVKYKKKRKEYDEKIEALDNKLEDLGVEQSAIKVKEKEVELAKTEAKVEKKNIVSLKKMIKEQDDLVEIAKSKKSISESNLVRLNDIKDYLNVIKNILKDENIKQFTIKQIMPFVNKQTNYYLSEVNYSFYVKIDKWLDVQVKGPGIRNATYGSLSGGERRGIDIAIQLSLLDVSRTQAGVFPDLLTFDELLDSSIDSRGINELLKIVKVKQKEFGGKVFIISHRDEIDSEMIDFQYKVVKQDGFSKVII